MNGTATSRICWVSQRKRARHRRAGGSGRGHFAVEPGDVEDPPDTEIGQTDVGVGR